MIKLLQTELSHFRSLSHKAQLLLISFAVKGASDPMIKVFVNAYIWQSNKHPLSVLFYNMGDFIALPMIFYINGLLLRKFRIQYLYLIGAMVMGISCVLVIFYTWFDPIAYILYGLLYGFGHGMYWANRNLLTQQETTSKSRNYFIGINYTSNFLFSIIMPLIIGWFIALGTQMHVFSLQSSYLISMLIALVFLSIGGIILLGSHFDKERITRVHLHTVTTTWIYMRLLMIGIGIMEASTFFLPTVLIMMNWGHEGILGTITAVTALISALGMYLFGRFADIRHRKIVFVANMIFGVVLATILAFVQNKWGVLLYVSTTSVTMNAAWLAGEPMMMDLLDEEHKKGANEKYAMVFDRELFLNIGRIIMYLVCLGLYYFKGIGAAFLYMPLLAWAGLSLISFYVLPKVK